MLGASRNTTATNHARLETGAVTRKYVGLQRWSKNIQEHPEHWSNVFDMGAGLGGVGSVPTTMMMGKKFMPK